VGVEPAAAGQGDDAEQDLELGFEPGHGVVIIVQALGGNAGLGCHEGGRFTGRADQVSGGMSGVEVVVEDPADRRVPSLVVFGDAGLLGGVGGEQVVEGVPARSVLGEQAASRALEQRPAGLGDPDAGQAGGSRSASNQVYVCTGSGLQVLDALTGSPGWSFTPPGSTSFISTPVVASGVIYVGCVDRNLYAIVA
jgi:hypothetical protein